MKRLTDFIKSERLKDRAIVGSVIAVLLILIGFFVLDFIAVMEKPPISNTFFILIGLVLVASGFLIFIFIFKQLYNENKRNKRRKIRHKKHKIYYLKPEKKKDIS